MRGKERFARYKFHYAKSDFKYIDHDLTKQSVWLFLKFNKII